MSALALAASSLGGVAPLFWSSTAKAAATTITYPTGPVSIANGQTLTVTGTVDDNSDHTVSIYENNACSGTPLAAVTGKFQTLPFGVAIAGLSVGSHDLRVKIVKHNGTVKLDCTILPAVTVTTPSLVACTSYGSVLTTDLTAWDQTDTRPKGHNQLVAGGLHIWTDSNDSESKAAAYYTTNFALSALGTETIAQSIDYQSSFGLTPGLQLVLDFNNDGTPDGILVGEAVYGNNWWLNTSAAQLAKDGAPHTGGGNGSNWFGTAGEWSAAFPNAKVKAIGYSLGSGVYADGVLKRITLGCVSYTFNVPPHINQAPSVPLLASPANATVRPTDSTPPITNQSSWSASTDPEGDSITYVYQSAFDPGFGSIAYTSAPLTDTFILNPDEPEITYYWHVKAVDSHGAESAWSNAWSITIDNTAPATPVHLSPANNTIQNINDFWFDWTDVDGVDHYEHRDSQSPHVDATGALDVNPWDGDFQHNQPTDSTARSVGANGTWYWQVRAVDAAGNASAWTTPWKITIDRDAPSAPTITTPSNDQYFATTPILNQWTASTDANGIATYQVAYRYDDGHTFGGSTCAGMLIGGQPVSGCRDETTLQRNHTPGGSEQGGVTVWVRAQDNAGNWSDWSTPVHYYYDATAPTVPTNGQPNAIFKNTNVFNYTWDSSTDNVGPITYEYQASQNPAESGGVLTTGLWQNWISGNSSQYPLTNPLIPSVGTSDGTWYWQVRAVDAAGNRSGWSTIWSYTLDSQAPQVTIDSYGQTNNVIQPSVTAHDPTPGTALTFLWDEQDGVTVSDITALNPTFTVNTDGTYTFHLTVTDQAGNSTTVPFTFTYATPPNDEGTPPDQPDTPPAGGFGNVTTDNGTPTTPAPRTLADNNTGTDTPPVTGPQVLGDSTDQPSSGVKGDSTVNTQNVAAVKHGKFLGLGWWWLAILGALGLFWLILAAGRRRDEEGAQG